jgi:phage gp36-like protein
VYCDPGELLVGDLPIGDEDRTRFTQAATDEINSKLGSRYVLPLSGISPHALLNLKRACQLIATGRYILAAGTASEDGAPNAYGLYCLREGQDILKAICDGDIELTGAARVESMANSAFLPSVVLGDASSAVDTFYDFTMRDRNVGWSPGF